MNFALDKIPFSAYGSYFVISKDRTSSDLYLRDLHGGDEAPSNLYRIQIKDHSYEELIISRTPTQLTISSKKMEDACMQVVFGLQDTVHFLTTNLVVTLFAVGSKYDTLVPLSDCVFEHHLYTKQIKVRFTKITGYLEQSQQWKIIGSHDAQIIINNHQSSTTHVVVESYRSVWQPKEYPTYEKAKQDIERTYQKWDCSFENKGGTFEQSRQLASYITWSNFVHEESMLTCDAMYMSKNWMFNIWSWDNCFGGIALSKNHPALAYGQLKIFMDHQDNSGCYPDYVNETFASFNCVKPPIHAWAYCKMMDQNPYFSQPSILKEVYSSLCKVTDYWCNHRQNENAIFPVYYHGNDSGWDNASIFHKGFPVESPDLAGFLIFQMDQLSTLATKLNLVEESKTWKQKADALFDQFISRFYTDGQFRAIYTPTQEKILLGDSLITYLPIIIGYRFDAAFLNQMICDLETRFETPYGLATECPQSPLYKKGGYWLGPIWAPTTYLFIDSLRANGYPEFAKRLAHKFCNLTTIGLMAENYDPFTGEGYDDPAFAWPSCVLLTLLSEYHDLEEGN
ncbi:MAG: hypothetical protein RSB96_01700 [Oscillospiraceae bacterium]